MKTATDRLAELNARLKDMPKPDRVRIPDAGTCLQAGQLWAPRERPQDREDTPDQKSASPSWLYLLIEPLQDELFNAVPVFRWTELADEDDLLLPASLTGIRQAASLPLESTIDRTMLDQCQGRYPDSVIEYILAARMVADDPVARNQYRWGAPLLGPNDHRIAFHNAISDAIEAAQDAVRQKFYTGTDIIENETYAFESLSPIQLLALFALFRCPKFSDTGERITPAVLLPLLIQNENVVKESSHSFFHATVLKFDPLSPGDPSPICCEWHIDGLTLSQNATVKIYDSLTHKLIGACSYSNYDNETLITLSSHTLEANAAPINDPEQLRIVIQDPIS